MNIRLSADNIDPAEAKNLACSILEKYFIYGDENGEHYLDVDEILKYILSRGTSLDYLKIGGR